jgi:exodeoxyribonuclease-3
VRIATWNVNSLRIRLPLVLDWLNTAAPDVLCLQEIKCQAGEFPTLEFEALGYHAAVLGQKSYNGVAFVSRQPAEGLVSGLPGDESDLQARYLEARFGDTIVACLYAPNGNPVESEKFPYKLAWMDRLHRRVSDLVDEEQSLVFAGDYNICPTDDDVYDPVGWRNDALCRHESRSRLRSIMNLGFTDAFRALHAEPHQYTFWDYQAGRWPRGEGLRIDHLMLSPQAADRLVGCEIDPGPRGRERASDHTPVYCDLD